MFDYYVYIMNKQEIFSKMSPQTPPLIYIYEMMWKKLKVPHAKILSKIIYM